MKSTVDFATKGNKMLDTVISRLKEPSTWAGIGALVLAITGVSEELWGAISAAGIAVAGVAAVVLSEKSAE
jgi:hypothetical protein